VPCRYARSRKIVDFIVQKKPLCKTAHLLPEFIGEESVKLDIDFS
jgi:hypothetical protein